MAGLSGGPGEKAELVRGSKHTVCACVIGTGGGSFHALESSCTWKEGTLVQGLALSDHGNVYGAFS